MAVYYFAQPVQINPEHRAYAIEGEGTTELHLGIVAVDCTKIHLVGRTEPIKYEKKIMINWSHVAFVSDERQEQEP